MAQATLSCPFGAIHLEDRRGTAQDERFALIFALPPAPPITGDAYLLDFAELPARKI